MWFEICEFKDFYGSLKIYMIPILLSWSIHSKDNKTKICKHAEINRDSQFVSADFYIWNLHTEISLRIKLFIIFAMCVCKKCWMFLPIILFSKIAQQLRTKEGKRKILLFFTIVVKNNKLKQLLTWHLYPTNILSTCNKIYDIRN